MNSGYSRRHILRAGASVVALPFLESLGFRRFVSANDTIAPPKRMIFLGIGYGVTQETWYPDIKQRGANYIWERQEVETKAVLSK